MENLREHIKNVKDLKIEKLWIRDWDCHVWVKQLSGKELDRWEQSRRISDDKNRLEGIRAMMAIISVCNEAGELQFTEKDIDWLSNKSGAALNTILQKCNELNFVTEDDLQEIAKN